MVKRPLLLLIATLLILTPASAKKRKAEAVQDTEEAILQDGSNEEGSNKDAATQYEIDYEGKNGTGKKEKKPKEQRINWVTGLTSPFAHPLVIGSYNRFILRSDWALVKWEDVNHYRKMKFDHDWYWTNFVLHPYQGNLAYMGARNANFNFLGALAMSTVSSTIWENFFEKNAPSINDMVYTTIGAFSMGEMLYRLSISAGDVWAPLGYLFNPMRLYTDFTTGHKPQGQHGAVYRLSFSPYFTAGLGVSYYGDGYGNGIRSRPISSSSLEEMYPALAGVDAYVEYNDPYGHESNTPYSQFEMTFGGGMGVSSGKGFKADERQKGYDIHLFSNGILFSRTIPQEKETDTTIGMSMNYDFVWKNFYEFTSLAPGFVFKQRRRLPSTTLEYQTHLGLNLLGTTDMFFIRRNLYQGEDLRSYSYTSGLEFVGKFSSRWDNGDLLDFMLHSYLCYDLPDPDVAYEPKGIELINHAQLSFELPLSNFISIGFKNELYAKNSWYKNYPHVDAFSYSAGLFVRLNLKK
ncbi:MAG: DUF3943 domain-containing protein [Treponema sp.]|nr:DUF3943 domain-containing protein [Treponema sp.]